MDASPYAQARCNQNGGAPSVHRQDSVGNGPGSRRTAQENGCLYCDGNRASERSQATRNLEGTGTGPNGPNPGSQPERDRHVGSADVTSLLQPPSHPRQQQPVATAGSSAVPAGNGSCRPRLRGVNVGAGVRVRHALTGRARRTPPSRAQLPVAPKCASRPSAQELKSPAPPTGYRASIPSSKPSLWVPFPTALTCVGY